MTRQSVFETTTVPDVLRMVGTVVPNDSRRLAICPIHDDSTPSLRVFLKGFRCFGCGAHGGVADLVVALGYASDRAGAARWLEERAR